MWLEVRWSRRPKGEGTQRIKDSENTEWVRKPTDKLRRDVRVSPPGQGPRPGRGIAVMPVQLNEVSARALGQLGDLLAPPPCLPVAAALENQGPEQEERGGTSALTLHAPALPGHLPSRLFLLSRTSCHRPLVPDSTQQGMTLPCAQLGGRHPTGAPGTRVCQMNGWMNGWRAFSFVSGVTRSLRLLLKPLSG